MIAGGCVARLATVFEREREGGGLCVCTSNRKLNGREGKRPKKNFQFFFFCVYKCTRLQRELEQRTHGGHLSTRARRLSDSHLASPTHSFEWDSVCVCLCVRPLPFVICTVLHVHRELIKFTSAKEFIISQWNGNARRRRRWPEKKIAIVKKHRLLARLKHAVHNISSTHTIHQWKASKT